MQIKSIVIELTAEKDDQAGHATLLTFKNGMWTTNGPVYSRIASAQHLIWVTLRKCVYGGSE